MPRPRRSTTKKTYKPKPKYTRRKPAGRRFTGRRTKGGPMRLNNGHDPFAPFKFCKLNYTTTFGLTTGTTGVFGTEKIMAINDLFDPDYSNSGANDHQPYGFDQCAALYRRYIVNGVKIQFTATNPSADGMCLGAMVQPASGVYPLTGKYQDAVREAPMSWIRPLNNSGKQVTGFTQYVNLARLNGLSRQQWGNELDTYGALSTTSPSLLCILRMAAASDMGNSGDTVIGRVTLTFYAKFYERIVLPQSD